MMLKRMPRETAWDEINARLDKLEEKVDTLLTDRFAAQAKLTTREGLAMLAKLLQYVFAPRDADMRRLRQEFEALKASIPLWGSQADTVQPDEIEEVVL